MHLHAAFLEQQADRDSMDAHARTLKAHAQQKKQKKVSHNYCIQLEHVVLSFGVPDHVGRCGHPILKLNRCFLNRPGNGKHLRS
jgi:hypothetical protein